MPLKIKKDHQYTELYLVCQPVDADPMFQEVNKADVLEFLRQNKKADRLVPDWITDNDTERIEKLSNVLKQWMQEKVKDVANAILKNPREFIKNANAGNITTTIDQKFKIENFDLIVWEYATAKQV